MNIWTSPQLQGISLLVLALLSASFLLDWYAGSSCSMDDQTMLFAILSSNINEKTICVLNVKRFICISFMCSVSVAFAYAV